MRIDADTSMSPGSFEAALRGAGGAMLRGRRGDEPEGGERLRRHAPARPSRRDGAADGLLPVQQRGDRGALCAEAYDVERVSIVDFDVHHGNGSQEIFWADETVMYCSTHEMPLYPGTGAIGERGEHNTIVNAPLVAPATAATEFREAFETVILPRLREFKPEILVISAGFDAHTRDPLANLNLVEADYAWVTKKLMEIAERARRGRIVSVLEGGYDLEGLSRSVAAHVTALMRG